MEPTPGSQPDDASSTPPAAPAADAQRREVEVRVRRSPRYGAFMAVGALLGALAMWIIGLLMPRAVDEAGQQVDTLPVVGLAVVLGFAIGAGLGGLVAVIIDRRLSKRASTLVAEQTDIEARGEHDAPGSAA
ncbi:hypothetical protein [Agrococcus sp. ProA11]|uniref:hypothetical protein n=1 Tax=Agrococcus chionoecetis TaxID=3153752 RepID=UPI003260CE3A